MKPSRLLINGVRTRCGDSRELSRAPLFQSRCLSEPDAHVGSRGGTSIADTKFSSPPDSPSLTGISDRRGTPGLASRWGESPEAQDPQGDHIHPGQ